MLLYSTWISCNYWIFMNKFIKWWLFKFIINKLYFTYFYFYDSFHNNLIFNNSVSYYQIDMYFIQFLLKNYCWFFFLILLTINHLLKWFLQLMINCLQYIVEIHISVSYLLILVKNSIFLTVWIKLFMCFDVDQPK